jgi:ubiquinone/menaquinone biosynthesis C-methylase UbiE
VGPRDPGEQTAFWSRVAPAYDRVVDLQIGPGTRERVRERVAREGRLGNLVEFGCGTGFYTQVLAGKADRVLATDVSPGMLALAKHAVEAANVTFRTEDCQKTSLADGAFDTAFMSLVLHFTEPVAALTEVRRVLKPGGLLIVANLDPRALGGLDRIRCLARVVYRGLTGYRVKPPKGFGKNVLSGSELGDLLARCGFDVTGSETIRDSSRSSHIPVEYVRAVKV